MAAVVGKAWQEVSFIEVLSEAIGGFVFGVIALCRGWLDFRGAFETALECAGCAILIPLIAFILRVCFSAPAELVKESAESKKKEEINPKSIYPSIIVMLLAICSFLSVGLAFSLKFNFAHHEPPKQVSIAKPLPVKIIPRPEPPPEPPPTVSNQQVAEVETQKQYENFNVVTGSVIGDALSRFASIKAEKDAKIESDKRQKNLEAQKWWTNNLSYYQRSLVVLHDVLTGESTKTGDGIAQSVGYFQCLPSTIDPEKGGIKAATIGFQKNTNVDFLITITAPNVSGHRTLNISCRGGFTELIPGWGKEFYSHLHVYPDFDDDREVPIEKANDLIDESIKDLIASQFLFLSKTNK